MVGSIIQTYLPDLNIQTTDYKKTQKVMASCQFCYGEDDSLPKAAAIAMATRCYLACPLVQDLVDGHCCIVPIQHHLSMLEGDDDLWDEVRVRKKNFIASPALCKSALIYD